MEIGTAQKETHIYSNYDPNPVERFMGFTLLILHLAFRCSFKINIAENGTYLSPPIANNGPLVSFL